MSVVTYENSDSNSAPTALGFEKLNLHPVVPSLSHLDSGLIVFSGRTGAGKTTSQAALIKRMNETRDLRIMTIEDPIEVNYASGKSRITQYEVGQDVASLSAGVKLAVRTEPDVLQIGELRDSETAELAIYQASFRLVITSLHASSDIEAYQRLLDLIPVSEEGVQSVSLKSIPIVIVHQEWEVTEEDTPVLKSTILAL